MTGGRSHNVNLGFGQQLLGRLESLVSKQVYNQQRSCVESLYSINKASMNHRFQSCMHQQRPLFWDASFAIGQQHNTKRFTWQFLSVSHEHSWAHAPDKPIRRDLYVTDVTPPLCITDCCSEPQAAQ